MLIKIVNDYQKMKQVYNIFSYVTLAYILFTWGALLYVGFNFPFGLTLIVAIALSVSQCVFWFLLLLIEKRVKVLKKAMPYLFD